MCCTGWAGLGWVILIMGGSQWASSVRHLLLRRIADSRAIKSSVCVHVRVCCGALLPQLLHRFDLSPFTLQQKASMFTSIPVTTFRAATCLKWFRRTLDISRSTRHLCNTSFRRVTSRLYFLFHVTQSCCLTNTGVINILLSLIHAVVLWYFHAWYVPM